MIFYGFEYAPLSQAEATNVYKRVILFAFILDAHVLRAPSRPRTST